MRGGGSSPRHAAGEAGMRPVGRPLPAGRRSRAVPAGAQGSHLVAVRRPHARRRRAWGMPSPRRGRRGAGDAGLAGALLDEMPGDLGARAKSCRPLPSTGMPGRQSTGLPHRSCRARHSSMRRSVHTPAIAAPPKPLPRGRWGPIRRSSPVPCGPLAPTRAAWGRTTQPGRPVVPPHHRRRRDWQAAVPPAKMRILPCRTIGAIRNWQNVSL